MKSMHLKYVRPELTCPSMTSTRKIQLPASVYDLGAVRSSGALALVAVLMDGSGEMPAVLDAVDQWRMAVPRADWIGIGPFASIAPARGALAHILSNELVRRRMRPSQLIMLGRGRPGRLALDRVLDGTLTCAGVVVLKIPLTPSRGEISATLAGIRLVLHERDGCHRTGAGLIETMHRKGIDLRSMTLPAYAHDRGETLTRAAGIFLGELVAKASWHERSG
jgi:hypothetical protein